MTNARVSTIDLDAATRWVERLDAAAEKYQTTCRAGANIVWRRWGKGRPIVLLHGGAGSWLHWARNIEPLAACRTVWVPDLPGFGDSDVFDERDDADTLAPLVLHGIRDLLGEAQFDMVGFSFGGLVAGCIAAQRPPTLDRLILVSVAALGIVAEPPTLKPLRGTKDPVERVEIVRWNLNQMMLHDARAADDLAVVIQQRSAPRDRLKHRTLALTDAMYGFAAQWQARAYGIWGAQDVLYREQMPALRAAIDRLPLVATAIIEDAGHWLQYERAADFDRQLAMFLDDLAADGAAATTDGRGVK
ncbi:MAG: alpha/beta fold hydrolase [Achromobacter veterisilvae]